MSRVIARSYTNRNFVMNWCLEGVSNLPLKRRFLQKSGNYIAIYAFPVPLSILHAIAT